MILTVTLNPSVDHALFVREFRLNDTNRAVRVERDAGGKGVNASRVVHGLGAKTLATGLLGGGTGAYVREVLTREGVPHDFCSIAEETRLNISIEESTGTPPTCVNEPGPDISPEEYQALLDKVERLLPQATWLLTAGSLPPGVPKDAFAQMGRLAQIAGVRWALDADGEPLRLGIEASPTFIKPNSKEAERLLGWPVRSEEEAIQAATELRHRLDGRDSVVVLSRGADGAIMTTATESFSGVSPKVTCRSTVGSGDSMVAAMLASIDRGRSAAETLRYGLAAGAATAGMEGSGLAKRQHVEPLLEHAFVKTL